MNIKDTLNKATPILLNITKTPRLEAEILLAYVIKQDKSYLVTNPDRTLVDKEVDQYMNLVFAREDGIPIAYLIGKREFYGLDFGVNSSTLIPRPETELLVEQAIKHTHDFNLQNCLEVGTGSGCISISLIKNSNIKNITAIDISQSAINTAKNNAKILLNSTEQRKLVLTQSDIFSHKTNDQFDLLISNPPYIPTSELSTLPKDVKAEPVSALDGGKDGLLFYRKLNNLIDENVTSNGIALFEIHSTLPEATAAIFRNKKTIIHNDLSGKPRVIEVRKN